MPSDGITDDETVASIADICASLNLAASPRQLAQLAGFLKLLGHWNAAYNLTAVRLASQMLSHHLADCLAIVPAIDRHLRSIDASPSILDVGSGGGLPGVVLAVMLPHATLTCVDKVGKKAAFVRQAAGALGLSNLRSVHARVEDMGALQYHLITARAVASLADLARWTSDRLSVCGVWAAMKGKVPETEIADLPTSVAVFHVEHLIAPGLQAERCLVWMRPSGAAIAPRVAPV